jgi:hypothetical protein
MEAARAAGAHSSVTTTEGYLAGIGEIRVKPVSIANIRTKKAAESGLSR